MTAIAWDEVGTRKYQSGVDRGVLFLTDGDAVAWNGLVSVEEQATDSSTPYYIDGVKYLDSKSIGDFSATIKAYTYPDEFDEIQGIGGNGSGVLFDKQGSKTFGLTYRTRIGNDVDLDLGYKIHLLYNLTVISDAKAYNTIANQVDPITFSWTVNGVPIVVPRFRPTAHIILDTTQLPDGAIEAIEDILYGTDITNPRLLEVEELLDLADGVASAIHIVDNGDDTWTATGPATLITMTDESEFQIAEVNSTVVDPDTYSIPTT